MSHKPEEPLDVERVLMDRARRMAERQGERFERPLLPRLVGIALSVVVVVIVLFAFDRFLASMQRFLGLPVVDPAGASPDSIPAYVVPLDPNAGDGTSGTPGQSQDPGPAAQGPSSSEGAN